MAEKRGSYIAKKTRRFTREEMRARECQSKRIISKVATHATRFLKSRGIASGVSHSWIESPGGNDPQPVRFVKRKPTPHHQVKNEPRSLQFGTAAFALRVQEELRIQTAAGKVKWAEDQQVE